MRREALLLVVASVVVVAVLVVAAVIYVVVVPGYKERTVTQYETTSSLFGQNVTLVGSCVATTYFEPDTVQILVTNVTSVSNGTTTYYISTYSTVSPTPAAMGSATYSSTTNATRASTYVITTTSNDYNVSPSGEWSVSVCTFTPG